jgi:DNA (cytosine-5)-methyltransferase 1
VAVAFDTYNQTITGDTTQTLCSRGDTRGGNAHLVPAVQTAMQVRRLTPRECERLQGFPDDYTAIPWRGRPASECPDGPRYKALGNSMAVPVMRYLGERIVAVESER